ncbi:MAG: hypothetical protein K2W96_18470 [Gemmataceae bacterium]|nr:hypothetical protein [Gemmataceae bacterium]
MMRLTMCAVLLALPALAEDKPVEPAGKARELKIEKKPDGRGKPGPVKATSADELAKAVPNKDTAEEIAKQVNFKSEYVVVWHWSGSGGDKLSMEAGEKEAVFTMKRGRTRDLRQHFHAFALPKGMTYKTAK